MRKRRPHRKSSVKRSKKKRSRSHAKRSSQKRKRSHQHMQMFFALMIIMAALGATGSRNSPLITDYTEGLSGQFYRIAFAQSSSGCHASGPNDNKWLEVKWDTNGNPDATQYKLDCNKGGGSFFEITNTIRDGAGGDNDGAVNGEVRHNHSGLPPNERFCYRVMSKNGDGIFNPSTGGPFTPGHTEGCRWTLANLIPDVNVNLNYQSPTPLITVSWDSEGNPPITQYELDKPGWFSELEELLGNPPNDDLPCSNTTQTTRLIGTAFYGGSNCNVIPNVFYKFKVRAWNNDDPPASTPFSLLSNGFWSPANPAKEPIYDPFFSGVGGAIVHWDANENREGTRYIVCRKEAADPDTAYKCVGEAVPGVGVELPTCPQTQDQILQALEDLAVCPTTQSTDFVDSLAQPGTTYDYKVVAINDDCPNAGPDSSCHISPFTQAIEGATGRAWTLDFETDFDAGQKLKAGNLQVSTPITTEGRSGGIYGNGAVTIGPLGGVPGPERKGEALYTFELSSGTTPADWSKIQAEFSKPSGTSVKFCLTSSIPQILGNQPIINDQWCTSDDILSGIEYTIPAEVTNSQALTIRVVLTSTGQSDPLVKFIKIKYDV